PARTSSSRRSWNTTRTSCSGTNSMTPTSDRDRRMRWLLVSQSIALFGTGIVFPFYVVFTRQIGANFTQFGIAYALFSLSAAATHALIGRWSDRFGRRPFLLLNSWGTAGLFLLFPLATTIWHVYILQAVLGVFGAMHRTSEKALLADLTDDGERGRRIGVYHGWVSIFSALAVMVGGYLIDLFTLSIIFYIGSPILFVSGIAAARIAEPSPRLPAEGAP
ncbi:MAG TPA: MFS transporter, partial [Candidatus Thermoplasmatota archaeon]|nr:MFS transporter [Candidatus Thermoplasmatota archaeon]